MNRILFEVAEINDGIAEIGDVRAEHILKILHGEIGQEIKVGVVDGRIGSGRILEVSARDSKVKISLTVEKNPLPSWCDLILAPPRPRVMKRLLPQLATLGVGRIFLVGAKKVEKDFWGATLLKEANYRPLLIDGLMQGGVATELPRLETRRNFRKFLKEEIETLFPATERYVAHPYGEEAERNGGDGRGGGGRRVFAVGPEGGWTEEEVSLLEAHGFRRLSLGKRILRTDTALVALLSRFLPEES